MTFGRIQFQNHNELQKGITLDDWVDVNPLGKNRFCSIIL
jgi:NADH:ubiquinone oxidoreductase subunit C